MTLLTKAGAQEREELTEKQRLETSMKPVDPSVYRSALDRLDIAKKALKQIAKGEGRFSRDQFEFACNTIDDMKELAIGALDAIEYADVWDATPDDADGIPIPPQSAKEKEHG
jgi:hypothetical protein